MKTNRTLLPKPNTTRLSSLLIGATVGIGIWLLATVTGAHEATLIASLAGGLLGITLIIHSTETPVGKAIAVFLLPVTAIAGLVAFGIPVRNALETFGQQPVMRTLFGQLGVTIAVSMATFGVIGTRNREIGSGAVTRLWNTSVIAWLGVAVALGTLLIVQSDALSAVGVPAVGGSVLTDAIFRPTEPKNILLTFWVLVALSVGTLKLLVDVAPIIELTPQTKQQRMRRVVSRINSTLNWSFVLLIGVTVFVLATHIFAVEISSLADQIPAVFGLFSSTGLRYGLVAGISVMIGCTLLIGTLQLVTGRVTKTLKKLTPALVAATGSVLAAFAGSPLVADAAAEADISVIPVETILTTLTPPGVVLAGIALSVGLLTGFLTLIVIAGGMKYIPQRSAGSAIASGSLAVGAIAAGVYGGHSLTVFSVVASSIVVWSVGDQNATVRAELGTTSSVQLEAIQTLSAIGLATAGILLAWLLSTTVLGQLMVSGGTLMGVLASVLGVAILIVILRG